MWGKSVRETLRQTPSGKVSKKGEKKGDLRITSSDDVERQDEPEHITLAYSDLRSQKVTFTGYGPFGARDLANLLPTSNKPLVEQRIPYRHALELVVVGNNSFSRDTIRDVVKAARRPPRFLPQEGFVDELLFGWDWWNDRVERLNATLGHHKGLQYAKFCFEDTTNTFLWPGTEPSKMLESSGKRKKYKETTPLFEFGYKIQGTTRDERWRVPNKAVENLGLREVAYTIARHCRNGKRHPNDYTYAIGEWEHDLSLLKAFHYDLKRGVKFTWPTTRI